MAQSHLGACCPQAIAAIWVSGNITIKLGYANAKIYKKKEPEEDVVPSVLAFWNFPAPLRRWAQDEHPYTSRESSAPDVVENDSSDYRCGMSWHMGPQNDPQELLGMG